MRGELPANKKQAEETTIDSIENKVLAICALRGEIMALRAKENGRGRS